MAQLQHPVQDPAPQTRKIVAEARTLASRLPKLMLDARHIASTLSHGLHGRRRAGPGETFWQFRPFTAGEPAQRIDWRRSARDDTRLFIRDREWEAAHTLSLWIDRSPSMAFKSGLSKVTKEDRALTLGLALAQMLVAGGEKVGLIGLMPPLASSHIIERMAEALLADRAPSAEMPEILPLPARSEGILIGDLLLPPKTIATTLTTLAAQGALGHLIRIVDPVEETFPFSGETELVETAGQAPFFIGNAADFRARYIAHMAGHDAALRMLAARHGWTYQIHHTDKPATDALRALMVRLSPGQGSPGQGSAATNLGA